MKKIIVAVLAVWMAVASALCFASCSADQTLVVYTESGFAPFEYVKDGKIVGVDVEIMELVGKKLGKTVVFEDVNFSSIIDAVRDGKLTNVGAAGISIDAKRKEKVDFSNEYYTANLYVIYPVDQAGAYESMTTDAVLGIYWDSLAGKKVAVQSGTTADLFLSDELTTGGLLAGSGATAVQFDKLSTAVADIGLNADVLIIDELPAKKLIEGKTALKCAPLYSKGTDEKADEAVLDTYAICVTKGETELLNAINEVLAELGKEGIQALVEKHLGIAD